MMPRGQSTSESIRDATRKALCRADGPGCESLILSALGTGSGGFSTAEGARTIARVLATYRPEELTDVRLIGHADGSYRTIRRVCDEVLNV